LLRLLVDTPYYNVLKKFDPAEGQKIDIVKIEIEFNKLYYGKILSIIRHTYSGEVQGRIKNSFGMQIDLSNITDIIRLKKYFNAKSDYIKTLLLPFYFKVNRSELDSMMEASDADAVWQSACETYYGKAFKKNNFEFVENYAQQIMFQYHKHLFVTSTSAPIAATSYLQLKEIEIQNIIHIIEGIRYELAPAEIGKLLVGVEI
jgi:V/A-type H+-transporting ATPase subunit C